MATITFKRDKDYEIFLGHLEEYFVDQDEILKQAVYEGSKIVADEIRSNLEALPTEPFHYLWKQQKFELTPEGQKRDLLDSFGLAPIERDRNGWISTRAGFDGFGSYPTKRYPNGVPNQLLARAIESGTSVREKHPFVRPAVNATRNKAVKAMKNVIDEAIRKLFRL